MREYTTSSDPSLLREMNLGDNYVCNEINDGLPLCCVVSSDNFLRHRAELYSKSILISPVPENPSLLDRFKTLSGCGIRVLIYGTRERLASVPDCDGILKIDVRGNGRRLRDILSDFGYGISYTKKSAGVKPPTMAISRCDNALFFSVYNSNTTTDTHLKFPLGAPILNGMEAEMINGASTYRFSRSEHRECRIFAEQPEGVISCREAPPVNARYRRAIKISGLEDATLRLFPERGCEALVSTAKITDCTPQTDPRFVACDDENGVYLKGEHVSGTIYFLIGRRG